MMPIQRQRQMIETLSQQGRVLDFIRPGDAVFLDSSSTCWFLAHQLPDIELTVLTHSLRTVETLAAKSTIRPLCPGGGYSVRSEDFTGAVAERPLAEFLINKAFFPVAAWALTVIYAKVVTIRRI